MPGLFALACLDQANLIIPVLNQKIGNNII
jgi:hypothetical protein